MAQLVRDEWMAAGVARAIQGRPEGVVVVLAGRGHVDYGLGIPDRVTRATGQPYLVVLPTAATEALSTLTHADRFTSRSVGDLLIRVETSGGQSAP